jgi:hypothetical protein
MTLSCVWTNGRGLNPSRLGAISLTPPATHIALEPSDAVNREASTRALSRFSRCAKKISKAARSSAASAMTHEMATTPVPGQMIKTNPITAAPTPIVVMMLRSLPTKTSRCAANI